ncbi:MAG: GTP 3',8-cyclase MoaA [Chloroflexi bacterium]|nr:GTP 3',8-cyclase MoaA [Chloroflexota bacterium]MCL5075895.1 GTP 3',8-cyclase MoaA [Chloroflexota bacterium]
MTCLRDGFNRPISYLRISVTDRCNFRCLYCMPLEGIASLSHAEILSYEEMAAIVRAAAELGIRKVRLTGGEPLVRLGLTNFIAMLRAMPGIDDLSLTTNGFLLSRYAADLKRAGLKRINVSLDTLRPDRFQQITRLGRLEEVLKGIETAQAVGLQPLKINTVVIDGFNADELIDIATLTIERNWHIRFIELMPVGGTADWAQERYIPLDEIKRRIEEALGHLEPHHPATNTGNEPRFNLDGPARYYRLPRAKGTIGFISPISCQFCAQCNRLRLTADGRLRPCLLSEQEVDLRSPLRQGATIDDIKQLIRQAAQMKPLGHRLNERVVPEDRSMYQIGG